MAKFVLAGSANCPYFARAELLADKLQTNLPDFKIHKIVKTPDEWENWLSDICMRNGWAHSSSPVIWRELISRGGKGVLIGGSNEFQEYAAGYYGISSSMQSSDMSTVGSENMKTHLSVSEEKEYIKSLSKPLHVCITNAASPVIYHMLHEIASGDVTGRDTELSIHLLVEEDEEIEVAQGLSLETVDMACPLLRKISITADPNEAINQASLIIIMDNLAQKDNESWEDWIKRCGTVYTNYGLIIRDLASSDCKIVVGGTGPVNLGGYLIQREAKNILRQNIIVPSRLPENRAKSAIARRINVNSSGVVDIIVWGNCGGTNYLDVSKGRVHNCEGAIWGPPSYSRPIKDMVHDDKWLQNEYLEAVKSHKETIVSALQHSAAVSEAHSVVATISDWWSGENNGEIYSMGVISDGCYEIPEGLVFSLPVKFQKGNWRVVEDVSITNELKEALAKIVDELEREIEVIFPCPKEDTKPSETIKEESGDSNNEQVFGNKEESDSGSGVPDVPSPVDEEENETSRSGPLSRIAEEIEIDTNLEGTPVTDKEV